MSDQGSFVSIRLRQFPVSLWARTDDEARDLMREFALITIDQKNKGVPHRLLELVADLGQSYGSLGADQTLLLAKARQDGLETIEELTYAVPPGIGPDITQLGAMLDEADDYCRQGEHLLSLASSPAAKAFRDWFIDEFVSQLAGKAPTSWPESRYARQLSAATVE
jgi:hypothetical protein